MRDEDYFRTMIRNHGVYKNELWYIVYLYLIDKIKKIIQKIRS
jgi:hypothetical protein